MSHRLLILGAGFAGVDAALAAARLRHEQGVGADQLEIVVVAPTPTLTMRPRLYEANPEQFATPLTDLFKAVDIRFVAGTVVGITADAGQVTISTPDGDRSTLDYDRLVLATGSRLFRPDLPGLAEHAFSVDQLDEAVALDRHIKALPNLPASPARDTLVIAGGGFTGIEAAAEMPARLLGILPAGASIRVVLIEREAVIGPELGEGPRPVINHALSDLGVEVRVGTGIASVDPQGVVLENGERVESLTVIWSAGLRASPITALIDAERDALGRLSVDRDLRVVGVPNVFATGDVARAATDDAGNFSLMSCQHAKRMGSFAGFNAAAELLAVDTHNYVQIPYTTCLDLGPWGSVYSEGWERLVRLTGSEAKPLKQEINSIWIYPPKAEKEAVFAYAIPEKVVDISYI